METEKSSVNQFISSRVGIPINSETIFFDDLGISGLDADTLMTDLSSQYGFDSSTFDSHKYYSSEYELGNIFSTLYKAVFNRRALQKMTFTTEHVYQVIERGVWFDP